LEPIIPSLLTRFAHKDMRGLSTGIYNTVQFVGAFLGGVLGGLFLRFGIESLLYTYTLVSALWFLIVFNWKIKLKEE
jgi:MFS family permease